MRRTPSTQRVPATAGDGCAAGAVSMAGAPPGTAERVAFLRGLGEGSAGAPQAVQTHMSWLFLDGGEVLKLKKPVRHPYLDFTTLTRRELACREELRLNERLAPGVYLGLSALCWDGRSLKLVPEAETSRCDEIVDWLVRMRRLPAESMLDRLIARDAVTPASLAPLAAVLLAFYRAAPALSLRGVDFVAQFARDLDAHPAVLLHPRVALRESEAVLRRFARLLRSRTAQLVARAEGGHVVDGHGDLRPEHVCLLDPPVIIDALEFNADLRRVDPADELAFLDMECEAAGAAWIGPQLTRAILPALDPSGVAPTALYVAHRALLRARLCAAHLLDEPPADPAHWLPRARRYLGLAERALDRAQALSAPTSPRCA